MKYAPERNHIYLADRLRLMQGIEPGSVDLAILDPPYNMGKAPWDHFPSDLAFLQFMDSTFDALRETLRPGGSVYLFNTARNLALMLPRLENGGFRLLNWLTWDKRDGMGNAYLRFSPRAEHILLLAYGQGHYFARDEVRVPYESTDRIAQAVKSGIKKNGKVWYPDPRGRLCADVWRFPSQRHVQKKRGRTQKLRHPTPKPVAMIERMIRASSQKGDLVIDPFAGSGATAIAAHKLGRDFIAGDNVKEYVDLARANLAAHIQGELT